MNLFADANAAAFDAARMKKNNLFTTERMFCDVYCFEPGQEQAGHAHPASDKVYYVLDGRGLFEVGGDAREVGPGTAVLAPAGQAHSVKNNSNGRLRVLVFMAPKP